MVISSKKGVKKVLNRSYLNKDFDAMRSELLQFARTFYSDKIQDFSEASVGGMMLDFAAFVGDTNSFYLDHQFKELDPSLAVESSNIKRHLKNAGVKITGASPAVVAVSWAIEVPVKKGTSEPKESLLPIILEGSVVESNSGVVFELTEDLDFSSRDKAGKLKAKKQVGSTDSIGNPLTVFLTMGGVGLRPRAPEGICISGARSSEKFTVPNSFQAFREFTLGSENVTQIISVADSDGNQYHEVDSLTQDTVFSGVKNISDDNDAVEDNLEVIPAPYRFVATTDFDTKLTTLRFGAGDALTLNDDLIPDPSELALPLYGKKQFSRFTLDPGKLLRTQTLGVAPQGTTITVTYRHGGGLSHNVITRSIATVTTLRAIFPGNPAAPEATAVRASVSVTNTFPAAGGENAPTLDELKAQIGPSRNAQARIVSKPDLLSRIYTMPSNFGRVFRAGIRSNPRNPLATQLFIISRDINKSLVISPDSLKLNLRRFLNEFRLISDAIDIFDAQVINLGIEYKIATEPDATKSIIIQDINSKLKRYLKTENFQIDQPLKMDDIHNIIFNTVGVVSVIEFKVRNYSNIVSERRYSDIKFDVASNTKKRLLIGPPGSIFEIKYPNFDIIGSAI